ncbi:MAG TPA: ATP-dependent zinc metalloprotease FtsH [Bryobacteraceae bacterium]|nr:ATP-dependent zinc metalloprotease FtsH [Bryobacteraceae bacterium]
MNPTQSDPKKPVPNWPMQDWHTWIWYAVMMLAMLWVWQESFRQIAVHTVDYSEFKQDLANGEVVECAVGTDEIDGKIQPKAPATHEARKPAAVTKEESAKAAMETPAAETEKAPSSPEATRNSAKAEKTTGPPAGSGTESAKAAAPAAYVFRTVRVEDPDLVRDLEKAHVKFNGVRPSFLTEFLWTWILPIGLIFLLWRFLARRMQGLGQSVMNFGSSRAKLVADKDTKITFGDVAGCEEAKLELQEVVTFLKHPDRYRQLGAQIPKGVLLVGPPGTGKTLLARAAAGEAHVPFFSISGSEFVEMFVGVGAARVRDLFLQAKTQAPCIVFIDELDAVGRQRGVHAGPVNDEREQTLNQLLVGMDGFEANVGVVVLAATNRPEILDRALLRPGRFDRQIVVDAPDLDGRAAILNIHARGKPLARDADLRRIAQETPGFSGADLANLINEAALLAARRNAREITQADLQEAVEKVVAGPERKSRRLNAEDKRRVAYHEVGHALVAAYCEHSDTLHKISIVPRGRAALGYTLQLPENDQYLRSRSELIDKITGLLGGRAAEEVVFNEISTGAENDLEHATIIARQMVSVFGMDEKVGLVHWGRPPNQFLPWLGDGASLRDCSEATARELDEEIRKILDDAHERAQQILKTHRDQLDTIASELLKRETMDASTFKKLIEQKKEQDHE